MYAFLVPWLADKIFYKYHASIFKFILKFYLDFFYAYINEKIARMMSYFMYYLNRIFFSIV